MSDELSNFPLESGDIIVWRTKIKDGQTSRNEIGRGMQRIRQETEIMVRYSEWQLSKGEFQWSNAPNLGSIILPQEE